MIASYAIVKRYEDEMAEYEQAIKEFRELREKYEQAVREHPADEAVRASYADLEERQKQLREWFGRLNAQRDLLS